MMARLGGDWGHGVEALPAGGVGGDGESGTAPNLIIVMGLAPVATGHGGATPTAGDISFWRKTREKMKERSLLFFWSLAQRSGADVELNVYTVGNSEGLKTMSEAVAGSGLTRATVTPCNLTDDMLKEWTQPLVKIGLTSAYKYRLWDFGKFWIERVVPHTLTAGIVLDIDVVFRTSIDDLWAKFLALRDKEHKWMMAARPEPGRNQGSITPFLMDKDVENDDFSNTGVILMNLDRMRGGKFSDVLIHTSINRWCKTPFWRSSKAGAWPPEQWAFNVIWGMNRWSFMPLEQRWQANCVENEGPWPAARQTANPEVFLEKLKASYLLHFCNNKITEILPKEACARILPESQVGKCKVF